MDEALGMKILSIVASWLLYMLKLGLYIPPKEMLELICYYIPYGCKSSYVKLSTNAITVGLTHEFFIKEIL
jgi:hypothetical protein